MTNLDILKMALKNLAKRKLRTALTILSVVIGSSSIIIMVSLGAALNESFEKQINQMGSITNIELNTTFGSKTGITTDVINKVKAIDGVKDVTPIVKMELRVIADNKYVGTITFTGINASSFETFGYSAIEGRTLSAEDKGTYNAVANPLVAYCFDKKGKSEPYIKWIYSEEEITPDMIKVDLLNKTLKITTDSEYGVKKSSLESSVAKNKGKQKTYKINIVGIVEKPDMYGENAIMMPLDTLEKLKKDIKKIQGSGTVSYGSEEVKTGYERVLIKCDSLDIVEDVISDIKDIGEFQVFSEAEYINSSRKINTSIQVLLGAIGSISLFIAALGIANTMIMSIYERTREIGIMKVIGAKVSDIKKLFLVEAILIGFLGGGIGLAFSCTVSFGLNKIAPFFMGGLGVVDPNDPIKVSSINLSLAVTALLFSSFIGLIAGYFPAKRAVKIEALKAIKSE